MRKILFIVNVDWFFISHRLPIALKAKSQGFERGHEVVLRFQVLETSCVGGTTSALTGVQGGESCVVTHSGGHASLRHLYNETKLLVKAVPGKASDRRANVNR